MPSLGDSSSRLTTKTDARSMNEELLKIRTRMVGGRRGPFIGEVHRLAERLDGQVDLVDGDFVLVEDPDLDE